MNRSSSESRRQLERLARAEIENLQFDKLNRLLDNILPQNRFYREKLAGVPLPIRDHDELSACPLTTKQELLPIGPEAETARQETLRVAQHLTYPVDQYTRFHRTSGTHGHPLVVLDTADDWQWWVDTWQFVLDAAAIGSSDRAMMAFSFGPFIGFWSAHDALAARGVLVIPGGGMSSSARLEMLRSTAATVVCCTPSYALHLAQLARTERFDLASSQVRCLIVAGEPGGSVPSIREAISSAWNAEVIDHAGATEIGPWGYANAERSGLHLIESEFIGECLSPQTGKPVADGEVGELIITGLGRSGAPLIRYRTGDLVRPRWDTESPNRFVFFEGGVLGRVDDMMIIRGVNIYPSAIEQILREFPAVEEYRMTARKAGEMDALRVEVEVNDESAESLLEIIGKTLKLRLGLHVEVQSTKLGSLPRFELKGKRFIDERKT